ncbi:aldehyde dehydrogenase family protein (plasmid) [Rhodococcus ruber]|nr:aldehyde dehydrogenase family protein [Rhodococcus ruber]QXU56535.1 aldehyde dehydrogenase family protein [Rhodococcus sp. LW-XY12]UQB75901.1 aldehyde dehydrogenase family protein [Rhodococcus ruber]
MPNPGQGSLTSREPATGEIVAVFPVQSARDVTEVVDSARAAASWWSVQSVNERSRHLERWRRHIWRRRRELADLIHRENGKPVDDAIVEIGLTVEHIRWAERHAKQVLASRRVSPGILLANFAARVDHEPLGVVGVISPWNYPLYAANSSTAFALAAGNTVVIKPSEYTPAVADWYARAFGFANPAAPTGIVTVVTGYGDTGAALCRSGVDKIAFTGSTATGRAVMGACAETVTPTVLELGGKDAAIVAEDADLTEAAKAIAWGAFTNAGQTCVGVERVYVVRSVADRLLDLLISELRGVRVGTTYGAMTMPKQIDTVQRHLADAVAVGGEVVFGGIETPRTDGFLDPVLLANVPESCSAMREETFGPVLTVRTVESIDEAVELANTGDYGLSASVFAGEQREKIARRLDAGQVSINSVVAFAGMGAVPMGGTKGSGFGRLHGREGLLEFVRPRAVVRKRFRIPGFEPITLHRQRHVVPLTALVLSLRHGGLRRR